MNNDPLQDDLWKFDHQSRAVQDFRASMWGVWDDSAAREINLRYLNPHESDDAAMRSALTSQNDHLAVAHTHAERANDHARHADACSQQIYELVQQANINIRTGYSYLKSSDHFFNETLKRFAQVQTHILNTGRSCGADEGPNFEASEFTMRQSVQKAPAATKKITPKTPNEIAISSTRLAKAAQVRGFKGVSNIVGSSLIFAYIKRLYTKQRQGASGNLANAMLLQGQMRPAMSDAHHLVPFGHQTVWAREARKTLRRFGIDVDAAANGVFLQRSTHRRVHTRKYMTHVAIRLRTATSREEAFRILDDIRQQLLANQFPF